MCAASWASNEGVAREQRNPEQARDIEPMLDQCWASVVDGGQTLIQYWVDVFCLLGPVTVGDLWDSHYLSNE